MTQQMTVVTDPAPPHADDVEPCHNETRDRVITGTITVLRDSGFSTEEILRWLFTEDETLPGTPIEALRGDRGREVKRRAQALGF